MGLKEVQLITGDEIRSRFPQLRADDIVGGSFCPTDGFVDPYSAMIGFMTRAAEHGAKLWKNTAVTGIRLDDKGTFAVETARGNVSAPSVVNCAGAWAAEIAAMVGLESARRAVAPHAGSY